MAKPHRMTPARRAALKKAQLASARKRRSRGRSVSTKKRNIRGKKLAIAAGAVGVGIAAGITIHHIRGKRNKKTGNHPKNVVSHKPKRAVPKALKNNYSHIMGHKPTPHGKIRKLYHHTSAENAASIKKHGFKSHNTHGGKVHFSTVEHGTASRYGSHVVAIKVHHKHVSPDHHWAFSQHGREKFVTVHHSATKSKSRRSAAKAKLHAKVRSTR